MELGLVLGPDLLHGQHRFPGLGPSVVEIAPHNLRLLPVPARAYAEHEAAPGEIVQGRDHLGEKKRVPLRHQADARSQPQGTGHRRGLGEGHEGIHHVGVGVWDVSPAGGGIKGNGLQGHYGVLRHPDGLEAQILRPPGHNGHVDWGTRDRGNRDADLHDGLLLALCPTAPPQPAHQVTVQRSEAGRLPPPGGP